MIHEKTTATALSDTFTAPCRCKVTSVILHAGSSVTADFTLTKQSVSGAAYSTVLLTVTDAFTDIAYLPEGELVLEAGDSLLAACTNGGSATLGLIVEFEQEDD